VTAGESVHARARRAALSDNSEAVEDYAKAIHALAGRSKGPVATNTLAERLEVSPSSVTAMLKRMSEMRLVSHEPYHGVSLTDSGERVALEVIRHHRLIESYLTEALGMPWDRVHEEAEVLEHYISEDLERLIAAKLGDPSHDPHGDPIPDVGLELASEPTVPLTSMSVGDRGKIARVSDSSPEMLRYLADRKIGPGEELEVSAREDFGGGVEVKIGDERHSLGEQIAERILVAVEG